MRGGRPRRHLRNRCMTPRSIRLRAGCHQMRKLAEHIDEEQAGQAKEMIRQRQSRMKSPPTGSRRKCEPASGRSQAPPGAALSKFSHRIQAGTANEPPPSAAKPGERPVKLQWITAVPCRQHRKALLDSFQTGRRRSPTWTRRTSSPFFRQSSWKVSAPRWNRLRRRRTRCPDRDASGAGIAACARRGLPGVLRGGRCAEMAQFVGSPPRFRRRTRRRRI